MPLTTPCCEVLVGLLKMRSDDNRRSCMLEAARTEENVALVE